MRRQTRNQKQKKRKSRRNQRGGGEVQAMIRRFSGPVNSKPLSPKPAGVNTSSDPNLLKILNRSPELSTENPFPFENFNQPYFNHLRSANTIQAAGPKPPINAAVLNSSTVPHIPYTSSGPPIRGHVNYRNITRRVLQGKLYNP
jgi:hypothetical protein